MFLVPGDSTLHALALLPLNYLALQCQELVQEKQQPSVRVHANGALDPEDQFRATLDQALIQLQGEASFNFFTPLAAEKDPKNKSVQLTLRYQSGIVQFMQKAG